MRCGYYISVKRPFAVSEQVDICEKNPEFQLLTVDRKMGTI